MRIEAADPQGTGASALLAEAAAEARAIYPEFFPAGSGEPTNAPTPVGGFYLLAWQEHRAVASVALRPIDARTGELRLETGHRQEPAMALYVEPASLR